MVARSPLINVMVNAAYKAAKGLVRDFGEVEHLQVSKKGPADFVSQADLKSEQILKRELTKARPDYGLLLEEGGGTAGAGAAACCCAGSVAAGGGMSPMSWRAYAVGLVAAPGRRLARPLPRAGLLICFC